MKVALPKAFRSFRAQMVVLMALVTALVMLLLTVGLQFILADLSRGNVDRILEDRADLVASSAISASTGQGFVVPEGDLEPGVVVYDASGRPVAGVPPRALSSAYESLSRADSETFSNANEAIRVLAEPFSTADGQRGLVVVSERLAPYEEAKRYALIVNLATGALATIAAAATAAWVTSRALKPVAELASTAAAWSENDLTKRFDLGAPTNEITGLAATLDNLLDKVSAAIRSEQRLTSELAHELRTPLTTVQGTADLSLMLGELSPTLRENLEEISLAAHRMSTTITTLLELARSEASILDASSSSLVDVVSEAVETVQRSGVPIHVEVADQRVAAPRAIAVRALVPVLENAVRLANGRVEISSVATTGGSLRLIIEDDGPGVGGDAEGIFLPGSSLHGGSGAGLGLAIARRIARSVGGEVELTHRRNPTRFEVRLPRV